MLERRALTWLAALTGLFYWRYTLSDSFTFLETPDGANQILPWLDMQARAWNDGVFPLWDPFQWGGQPLLGLMQPGGAFPLNWALFALPLGADGHVQLPFIHWQQTLIRLLGGLFAFALARELGISRTGALLGGLAFACVGAVASSGWPQITNGMIWAPATGIFLARLLREQREGGRSWVRPPAAIAGLGATLGLALLSGHPRAPLFLGFAVSGVILWETVRRRRLRLAAAVPAVALVALGVGALQAFPAWEFGQDAVRWVSTDRPIRFDEPIPYHVDEALRLNPVHLFAIVIPIVPGAGDPYLGWTALILAGIGVTHGWRKAGTKTALGIGLGALLYSFGPQTPLHGWIYGLVPLAEKARGAGHALFLFATAAFILAARGMDLLESAKLDRWPARLLVGFASIAGTLTLAELALGRRGDPAATLYHGEFVMISGVAALLVAGILAALRRGSLAVTATQTGLVAVLLLEGGAAHWLTVAEHTDPIRAIHLQRLDAQAEALAFLQRQPEPFRFEVVPGGGGINLGDRYGLHSVEGYLTAVSENVYALMDERGWDAGRDLLNTVYTVAREATRSDQTEVFAGSSGWNVYRNPSAGPRAWVESECGKPGDATVVEAGRQSMTVKVMASCPGRLVLAEVWAPGWRAWVDGERREVEQVHTALRGVRIGAGPGRVRLEYWPWSAVAGGICSAVSLAAVGGILWLGRRRKPAVLPAGPPNY